MIQQTVYPLAELNNNEASKAALIVLSVVTICALTYFIQKSSKHFYLNLNN